MQDFKKLKVWRKAHALSLNVRATAKTMRGDKDIRDQMIRAAGSVPTNIVEGRAKASEAEFCRFLKISLASASELEYHLLIARDVGAMKLADANELTAQTVEVQKMLYGLIEKIKGSPKP